MISRVRKFLRNQQTIYGGCEYEMISSEKKSSCQKGIFDKHIYDIIKIATMVEEIDNNVFRRRCYESDY